MITCHGEVFRQHYGASPGQTWPPATTSRAPTGTLRPFRSVLGPCCRSTFCTCPCQILDHFAPIVVVVAAVAVVVVVGSVCSGWAVVRRLGRVSST